MAYRYKKRYGKRSYRSRRRYSRYRSSRYRKFNRRRFRRRSKVEYKRIEAHDGINSRLAYSQNITEDNAQYAGLYGTFCYVHGIGGSLTGNSYPFFYNISQGTAATRRIGNKINPVKLRVYGTISFTNYPTVNMVTPSSVMVRCVIYQVRNGNTQYNANAQEYSPVNPIYDLNTGESAAATGYRLFVTYPVRNGNISVNQQATQVKYIRNTDLVASQLVAKVPFRLGIGGSIKILKDKTYTLNTGHVTSIPFRFKCKKPNRLVWPESPDDENNVALPCKSNIYICWFIIPTANRNYGLSVDNTPITSYGDINISSSIEMFYTDL